MESHRRQPRGPALQLGHPVAKRRLGDDDEMWPVAVLVLVHVHQDRYGLECLAESEGWEVNGRMKKVKHMVVLVSSKR